MKGLRENRAFSSLNNVTKKIAEREVDAKPAVVKNIVRCKENVAYNGGKDSLLSVATANDIDVYVCALQQWRRLEVNFLKEAQVDSRMRSILLDWIMQIQSKFRLNDDTFFLACNLIDRVVKPLKVTRHNFQLVGLACIYIASKFEEVLLPNVHDFLYMGGDICNIQSLFRTEQDVLRSLRFKLAFAYPTHFLRKLQFYMPDNQAALFELSKILVDVSILDYKTAWWLPAEQVAAAVHLAYTLNKEACPIGLTEAIDVPAASAASKAKLLATRVSTYFDRNSKLQAVRMKYKGNAALNKIDQSLPYFKSRAASSFSTQQPQASTAAPQ